VRVAHRKLVSKKDLLEWMTAARAEGSSEHDLRSFFKFMWPACAIALVAAFLIAIVHARALPLAALFVLAWLLSPLIAFYVSRHRVEEAQEIPARDARAGRIVARRTWRFFQSFVGDEDHWLPADNIQEEPQVIAHRTSLTNIGLFLLSTLSAYDFGYIGLVELLERLEFTFGSLEKLQKFRGHYFNWHDTRTLQPMWPHYVSAVDSGNLAGDLIALKQAALDLPDDRLFDTRVLDGLRDTIAAITQETSQLALSRQRTDAITIKQLRSEI